jgi:hypothetical protein
MEFDYERQKELAHAVKDAHSLLKALERRIWDRQHGQAAARKFDSDNLLSLVSFIHEECEELRGAVEE